MNVTDKLRRDADNIWESIIEHPFVVELYTGSLPLDKFKFYVLQDYNYLTSAIKNFSIISSRAGSVDNMKEVLEIAYLEAVSELKAYEKFIKKLGYTIENAINVEPIQINVSYVSFLLSTSALKSYEESITSVLPCFWSYSEIAEHHKNKLKTNKNKLYTQWVSVYSLKPYLELVEKIRNLVDNAVKKFPYEKLKKIFIIACRYEYMYWDATYNMTSWPV